jgi:hypothetical protein
MKDYVGMGIQMALTGLGLILIGRADHVECNENRHTCGRIETRFSLTGWGLLLGVNPLFNIYRSYSYNEPPDNYTSNSHNGFNLAVLPSRHGEIMPYMTYNKSF